MSRIILLAFFLIKLSGLSAQEITKSESMPGKSVSDSNYEIEGLPARSEKETIFIKLKTGEEIVIPTRRFPLIVQNIKILRKTSNKLN